MPDHAHYKVALQEDIDLARRAREHAKGKPSRRPRVAGQVWTPERAALTDVADILLRVLASLEAQRTGKTSKPQSMPRPLTAAARLDQLDAAQRHRDRVRMMLPHQGR
ncbi:hypothetical protein [Amycolatopsis sp. CA-128772]|uniref:hypothetical protein n=1 Tax=Amycolatopsis sp. CA-128772 TaxID=2073159 RepID=UPI000CD296CC|nr:hypothetical protein [Amycolatopsis sp. CA-128772]